MLSPEGTRAGLTLATAPCGPTQVPAGPQGHLQLHDIATGRGAHQAGAHVLGIAVEGADVARVLVVIHHLPRHSVREGHSTRPPPFPVFRSPLTFLW